MTKQTTIVVIGSLRVKLGLLARNLAFNSNGVLNYKYITVKHIIKNTAMKQSKRLNGDLKPEYKKTTNMV